MYVTCMRLLFTSWRLLWCRRLCASAYLTPCPPARLDHGTHQITASKQQHNTKLAPHQRAMSGTSRVQGGRKANSAVQNQMRPPVARPASRGTAPLQSYTSAVRNGVGANIASSPARSVSSRSHDGNISPTDQKTRKPKDGASSRTDDSETNINVVVRCRGRSEREIRENSGVVVSTPGGTRGKEVALSMGPLALSNKLYTFDRVFGPEADQGQIYDDVVGPILEEVGFPGFTGLYVRLLD